MDPYVVQELSNADKEDTGGVPRTLEVELKGDLVDCCSAGDVITVLGLVKVVSSEPRKGGHPLHAKALQLLHASCLVTGSLYARMPQQMKWIVIAFTF
jgi:DNA replicative helicase MCM subunit Mcm2 (Cdc46/Mcm family)